MTKLMLFSLIIIFLFFSSLHSAVLKGTVTNANTHTPIPYATIISSQGSQTIMTNEDGGFILYLDLGTTNITCSHIAYYTYKSEFNVDQDTIEIDIVLNPSLIVLPSISVYERDYDAAQAIIVEAIRHKDEILSKLRSYQFDAYTKLFISYPTKTDSITPGLLTETQLTAYWRYPNEYKEKITARKQSSNVGAGGNTVTVDEVLNFNNNRVEVFGYSFVSPTAKDALDYYNYYLLDTIFYDTLPVFLLEVEPKRRTTPLFIGTIQINSQTYEIMGIDFKINEGLDSRFLKKLELIQEFQIFDEKQWMPVILKFEGRIDVPIPFIPTLTFNYTAALQRYQFDIDYNDTIFQNRLEIDKNADNFDSTQWLANKFIPFTAKEEIAYDYIDTAEFKIPLKLKLLAGISAIYYGATNIPDYFHFNRVEGAYLGLKNSKSLFNNKIFVDGKIGYALDAKLWQQTFGLDYIFSKKHQFRASYHDNIQTKKTINSSQDDNATGLSLLFKHDPFDYYREKGFSLSTSFSPLEKTKMSITYDNYRQSSITNNSDYSLFHKFRTYRKNPAITDGKLRSLKLNMKYDSGESTFSYPYTLVKVGAEISNNSTLKSDFEFTTIYGHYYTSRQLSDLGISSLSIYGTTKLLGNLPSQKYSVMDYGANIFEKRMMFRTLHHTNFSGSELLSIYYSHSFGTKLFKKLNFPLLKKIPYSLTINGGVFWSELKDNNYNVQDELVFQTGKTPYSEIGLVIGRLPLMAKVSFTWQLSAYETDKFYLGVGFDFDFIK